MDKAYGNCGHPPADPPGPGPPLTLGGSSDRQACCAACHWGDPGLGPLTGAALAVGLLGGLPASAGGSGIGTPCERMHVV
jgi:hypothetical protein